MVTGDAAVEGAIAAVRVAAFAYPMLKPGLAARSARHGRPRARAIGAPSGKRRGCGSELERSERGHREVVESIPAFVIVLDDGGRILTWNRQLEATTEDTFVARSS